MRVSVVINPRAGSLKLDLVKRKIQDALFRCDLHFHLCDSFEDLSSFIKNEIESDTKSFLICGGDGTVNATLQCMLKHKQTDVALPPICLISSGTANDLAHEMDISKRIDQAARLLFEGKEKQIDLIEVQSGDEKKYMLTNGGIGIPALAAYKANALRQFLSKIADGPKQPGLTQTMGSLAQKVVKQAGSMIYSLTLLNTIKNWKSGDWHYDVELPGNESFSTFAPFLLVNNQPTLGKKYLTAPYTAHNDGQVNLLLIESNNRIAQLEKVARVYLGNLKENSVVKSIETSEFKVKTRNSKKKITFFGDGEILFRNVDEVTVRCLKRNISVMVKE